MSLPLKSVMLTYLKDGEAHWDYELVERLMNESGKNSEYWKFQFRFWLMEFLGCGLITDVGYEEDDGTKFKAENVLSKYKITDLGLQRIETMLE
ncbi:MAG: hypothetical protein E7Z70_00115 [Thermoplasmata archaeon]|nr:hypothetical protein [Thermoplasmata archaeon]